MNCKLFIAGVQKYRRCPPINQCPPPTYSGGEGISLRAKVTPPSKRKVPPPPSLNSLLPGGREKDTKAWIWKMLSSHGPKAHLIPNRPLPTYCWSSAGKGQRWHPQGGDRKEKRATVSWVTHATSEHQAQQPVKNLLIRKLQVPRDTHPHPTFTSAIPKLHPASRSLHFPIRLQKEDTSCHWYSLERCKAKWDVVSYQESKDLGADDSDAMNFSYLDIQNSGEDQRSRVLSKPRQVHVLGARSAVRSLRGSRRAGRHGAPLVSPQQHSARVTETSPTSSRTFERGELGKQRDAFFKELCQNNSIQELKCRNIYSTYSISFWRRNATSAFKYLWLQIFDQSLFTFFCFLH